MEIQVVHTRKEKNNFTKQGGKQNHNTSGLDNYRSFDLATKADRNSFIYIYIMYIHCVQDYGNT